MADVARLRPAESSSVYDIKDALGRDTISTLQANVRAIRDEVRSVPRGGTGLSSVQLNQVVIGNGTSALKTTKSSGVGALQRSSTVDAPVFDTLPISMGGTGAINSEQAIENLGAASKKSLDNYAKNNLVSHVANGIMSSNDKIVFDRITGGSAQDIVLGDGTIVNVEQFFEQNADLLRKAIGLATVDHMGLVPELVLD